MEKYHLASKEFRRAIQQEDTGQLYGDDAKRTYIVDSKYERVQQNFGQLSAKVNILFFILTTLEHFYTQKTYRRIIYVDHNI